MRLPPLDVISNWPTPNYENPDTRGSASLIVNVIFIILVGITVALRFWCRTAVKQWFGADDVMIALATVRMGSSSTGSLDTHSAQIFTIGLAVVVILANDQYGWDRHIWDIPVQYYENASIIAMTAKVVFTLAATFTRLSLCMFYYRLVKDSGIIWFKWVVHANFAFSIGICISFVFLVIFLCTYVYWDLHVGRVCADNHPGPYSTIGNFHLKSTATAWMRALLPWSLAYSTL